VNDGFRLLRGVAFALLLARAALAGVCDAAGTPPAATLVARTIATLGGAAMVAAVLYAPLEVILIALWRAAVYRRVEFSDTHVSVEPGARRR
jgi:membrane protein implicated in regulation of membrane protease activity